MKKNKISLLLVVLAILIFSFTVSSQAAGANDFNYSVVDGSAVITGYVGTGGKVIVPSEIDGYAVTAIGEMAFENCETITELTVSDGISRIEERAFSGMKATRITFSDSVTYIGDYVFARCASLENVTLSANLEYIGHSAFRGTIKLKKIALPDSLTKMGGGVFSGSGIKTIKIPAGLTEIPGLTFDFSELTEITIPATVKEIGGGAFSGCLKLKKITFEGNIEKIGNQVFFSCNRLENINIPDSVTEIGESAFAHCSALKLSKLPLNLRSIGNNAFEGCGAITEIVIPDGVEKLGYRTFGSCKALERVDLNNVTEIGEEAFVGCKNLKQVIFGKSLKNIKKKAFSLGMGTEDIYVCYRGTESQWKNVKLNSNNHLNNDPVHFNYTQEHQVESVIKKATLSRIGEVRRKCKVCDYECVVEYITVPQEFKLSKSSYTYDGKEKNPKVIIKNREGKIFTEGTDYTVSYEKGRILPGKYTVKITFNGKYTGVVKRYFTIKPKATSKLTALQTTSTITLKWSKVTGADGYAVYMYDTKTKKYKKVNSTTSSKYKITGLEAGKVYKFKVRAYTKDGGTIWGSYSDVLQTATKTKAPTLSKLTSGTKQLTATWKTVSGATGYEVVYSTSKKFTKKTTKTVTIKKAKTKKTTIKKLKKGKKYYVKVRAYKTVNGKKIYGAYSSVKSVKVK
ncbi:MAG: leucine-rich repeat protein [Clostridia bacterium]|nr:leucine-rich repeat protein [Clostridia bacterium]